MSRVCIVWLPLLFRRVHEWKIIFFQLKFYQIKNTFKVTNGIKNENAIFVFVAEFSGEQRFFGNIFFLVSFLWEHVQRTCTLGWGSKHFGLALEAPSIKLSSNATGNWHTNFLVFNKVMIDFRIPTPYLDGLWIQILYVLKPKHFWIKKLQRTLLMSVAIVS